jgi:hypothetical protein
MRGTNINQLFRCPLHYLPQLFLFPRLSHGFCGTRFQTNQNEVKNQNEAND